MLIVTEAYNKFLEDNHKTVKKALEKNEKGLEGVNTVLLSEQNAILRQIGGSLALIADALHNRN